MEGHWLRLQGENRGTGWLLVRQLLAKFNVITVEVDIACRKFSIVGTAIVHIKVILQFKLRYGLDLQETNTERYRKVTSCTFSESPLTQWDIYQQLDGP